MATVIGSAQNTFCYFRGLRRCRVRHFFRGPSLTHGAEPFLCSYSRTSQHCMEPGGSLSCSLVPILSHINPIHTIPSYLSKIHFNIVHQPTSWSSQWSLSFWLSHQYPISIPISPPFVLHALPISYFRGPGDSIQIHFRIHFFSPARPMRSLALTQCVRNRDVSVLTRVRMPLREERRQVKATKHLLVVLCA
jgi:hypothetical protein